jgi:hypothetical protein
MLNNYLLRSTARMLLEDGWAPLRALRGGTRAMRLAGETLTPATNNETRDRLRYQKRLRSTVLWPIYDTTVSKLASLPFQKAPTISGELPPDIDRLVPNADRMGTTLASFARRIYDDGIDRGMGMFLVDNVSTVRKVKAPDGTETETTISLAEAEAMDARPFFRRIAPDNYLGCKTQRIAGIDVVVEFRFRESIWREVDGADRAAYRTEIWTPDSVRVYEAAGESASDASLVEEYVNPLGVVPLVVFYTNRLAELEATSPLEDLAWQNVAHWNSVSMQSEALRYCRFPILKESGGQVVKGNAPPDAGPGAFIRSSDPEHSVSFVEISGTSLSAGRDDIRDIEQRCYSLGMQPLMAGGPQTATGEIRADMNEKSEAQTWIEALEWAVWRGIEFAAMWAGVALPEDLDWTLFKDSSLISGRAQDVPMILQCLDKRLIGRETALRELVLRGLVATVEDPMAEIAAVDLESEATQRAQMEALAASLKEEDVKAQQEGQPKDEPPQDGPPKPDDEDDEEQAAA